MEQALSVRGAEGRSLPQRVCSLSVPTNRQRAGGRWKQAVALGDVALRKKRDQVEQSAGSGFSMPRGLPPLRSMDPAKKNPKAGKIGVAAFAQSPVGARVGSRCVQACRPCVFLPAWPGRGVPTAPQSCHGWHRPLGWGDAWARQPLPSAGFSPQRIEIRHRNVISLLLLPLLFCVRLPCAFFVKKQ